MDTPRLIGWFSDPEISGAIQWRWPQDGSAPPAALTSSFARGRAYNANYSTPAVAV